MNETSPMPLARLRALVDAYGANPERWPAAERAAAEQLLRTSPEAQRYRDAAAGLDALLDLACEPEPSAALRDRILATTASRASNDDAPLPRRHAPHSAVRPATARRHHTGARNTILRRVVPAVLAAAGIALVLWSFTGTGPSQAPRPVTVAEIGVYDLPTDVLLTGAGLDLLDEVPAFGCEGSGLGCLDPAPANHQSALTLEAYV
ncbi:hypothetical protein L6Q96_09570 [Candidatus Binatia bacterium]|nr:hypothetical protein [Candidatus Binatia bacterium]